MFCNTIHSSHRSFSATMFCAVLFIVASLMGPIYGNTEKPEWTEFSWQNNVYNVKFSVETRLEHCFSIEYTMIPMIITVCTLLSLLQLIKRFKLYVLKQRKLFYSHRETLTKLLESLKKYR